MYFGYILFSATKQRHYVGTTGDLERRFYEHQAGQNPSTRAGAPWEPVFIREFDTRAHNEELTL